MGAAIEALVVAVVGSLFGAPGGEVRAPRLRVRACEDGWVRAPPLWSRRPPPSRRRAQGVGSLETLLRTASPALSSPRASSPASPAGLRIRVSPPRAALALARTRTRSVESMSPRSPLSREVVPPATRGPADGAAPAADDAGRGGGGGIAAAPPAVPSSPPPLVLQSSRPQSPSGGGSIARPPSLRLLQGLSRMASFVSDSGYGGVFGEGDGAGGGSGGVGGAATARVCGGDRPSAPERRVQVQRCRVLRCARRRAGAARRSERVGWGVQGSNPGVRGRVRAAAGARARGGGAGAAG